MKVRFLLYLFLFPFFILAQNPEQRVKYSSVKNWMKVTTEHFDVAYYNDNKDFAIRTSKYLELAWREVCKDLDFEPKERYLVHVYPSVFEHAQDYENNFPTFYKNLNYFYLHKSIFSLFYNGTQKEFYKQIKTQLCKALLSEMFYKSRATSAFQTNLLVYLPDWYITGLSSFIGEGWDAKDEAILRGFSSKFIEKANQGFDLANHEVLKKSIWLFVASEYKPEKIAEILYMSRLTRTADGGFVTVLGTSMYRFSQNWINFIKDRIRKNESNTILSLKNQEFLQASTKNDKIAGISCKNGKFFLNVYAVKDQKFIYQKYLAGYQTNETWVKNLQIPLAWSVDASKIAVVLPQKAKSVLYVLETKTNELVEFPLDQSFDYVHSMSFTSQGKLLLSAYKNGQTDLFLLSLGQEKAIQLTKNMYDEIYPLENQSKYYYSAAYPNISGTFQPDSLEPEHIKNYYAIFSLNPENKIIQLENSEENANLFPTIVQQNLTIISDKTGTLQINSPNLKLESSKGLNQFSSDQNNILFAEYKNGKKSWNYVQSLKDSILSYNHKFSLEFQYFTKLKAKESKRIADSLERIRIELLKTQDSLEIENTDTLKSTKIRYYVFDDEDSVKTVQRTPKKKKKNRFQEHIKIQEFDIKQVKITGFEKDQWTPHLIKVGTFLVLDPLFRLGLKNELQITDALSENKFKIGFTPFMDFRSSDLYIHWLRKKNLLSYGLELQKYTRYFKKPQRIRYSVYQLKANVGMNWNAFEQFNVFSQTSYIKRTDLALTDARVLDGQVATQEFTLQYLLNKVKRYENYNKKGHSLSINFTSHALLNKITKTAFFTFDWDARKYFHLGSGISLATRFTGGVNFGPERKKFYIGGVDNWINSSVENKGDFPIEAQVPDFYFSKIVLPMRGFSYNARNGTQYGIINTELRIPLGSLAHVQLRSRSLYNFRWLIFADMGTCWTTGNPFSQKNPIDAQTLYKPPLTITVQSLKSPFIFGVGTGLQFYLSGYPIRFDIAFPIEDQSITGTKLGFSIGYDF